MANIRISLSTAYSGKLSQVFNELVDTSLNGSSTFDILPILYRSENNETHLRCSFKTGKRRIYGISKCQEIKKQIVLTKEHQQLLKSTCPWFVYLDYDSERLPQTIAKAECSCTNCIDVMGNNDNTAGHCQKVESYRPVIRRTCSNGKYVYYVGIETVPVGCSCSQVLKDNSVE